MKSLFFSHVNCSQTAGGYGNNGYGNSGHGGNGYGNQGGNILWKIISI